MFDGWIRRRGIIKIGAVDVDVIAYVEVIHVLAEVTTVIGRSPDGTRTSLRIHARLGEEGNQQRRDDRDGAKYVHEDRRVV